MKTDQFEIILVTNDSPDWIKKQIRTIYEQSFPKYERRSFDLVVNLYSEQKYLSRGFILACLKETCVLGFSAGTLFGETGITYLSILATRAEFRGCGVGSYLMQQTNQFGESIIRKSFFQEYRGMVWEVERITPALTSEEQQKRKRRISFYERLGATQLVDFTVPPLSLGYPEIPCTLMVLQKTTAASPYDWLDTAAVFAYKLTRDHPSYIQALRLIDETKTLSVDRIAG